MNAYLTERALEIDRQLKAAKTAEERRALIAARKLIRGAMERIVADPSYVPTLAEALRHPAAFVAGMTEM